MPSSAIARSCWRMPKTKSDVESIADLTKIHDAGQHLLKLVNEILDLSKIEAGKMELDLEETHLAELLSEIVERARAAAVKQRQRGRLQARSESGTALCDAGKFRSMAGQLLDNAMKFTHNGKVEVVARASAERTWRRSRDPRHRHRHRHRAGSDGQSCSRNSPLPTTPAPANTAAPDWAWRSARGSAN